MMKGGQSNVTRQVGGSRMRDDAGDGMELIDC